jgi:pSer/pThr/pTyr-binding forkhead associated (FHA) protein
MSNVFLVQYPEAPIRIPEKGKVTIGRGEKNSIILTEPRVSRNHAQIEWQKSMNLHVVSDVGSKNGTYVNGFKLMPNDPKPLDDWDKIRIASTVFTVRLVDDPSILKNEFRELRDRVQSDVTEIIDLSKISTEESQPAFSGDLEHLCPIELFQMLEVGRKTGMLAVKTALGEGTFAIRNGEILTAQFGNAQGEKGVYEVLRCCQGTFAFNPQSEIPDTPQITTNTTMLLMEGCRLMDEANRTVQPARPSFSDLPSS